MLDNMLDKLNPRDAVKGGRTEVFKMHTKVKDLCTHGSCIDLMRKLDRDNMQFIGVCLVRILAPKCLMVTYLPHKCDGKLMFLLCKKCFLRGAVQ